MRPRPGDGSWPVLLAMAEAEVGEVRRGLPPNLAALTAGLPIVFEAEPSADLVADGLDINTLGLFVGVDYPSEESGVQAESPTQIHLYLDNLWHVAKRNRETFRYEVRITYLHELGHFLGLDEDDLVDRDMD